MPILTSDKALDLMQITSIAQKPLLDTLIINFQDWLCNYLNNFFHTTKYISVSTISFSSATISDSASGFVTAGFADDNDIHVTGSLDNDGIYQVDTAAAGSLTLTTSDLVTETAGAAVVIWRMKFPKALQVPSAKCLYMDLQVRDPSVKSQSLSDWSETFDGTGRYPTELLRLFAPWKKFRIG